MTPGKAGGLFGERLKGADYIVSRLIRPSRGQDLGDLQSRCMCSTTCAERYKIHSGLVLLLSPPPHYHDVLRQSLYFSTPRLLFWLAIPSR